MPPTKPDRPAPGSPEAMKAGCTCPVLDNAHGQGFQLDPKGGRCYWITDGCVLHAPVEESNFAC